MPLLWRQKTINFHPLPALKSRKFRDDQKNKNPVNNVSRRLDSFVHISPFIFVISSQKTLCKLLFFFKFHP